MSEKKTKKKIQASDVQVGNRTLEAVLSDVAERSARADEKAAEALRQIAETNARIEVQNAKIDAALQALSALHKDHVSAVQKTEQRLVALEKAS